MKVVRIKERKDGSADVTIELSKKEENKLLKYALLDIIKKGIKKKINEKMVNRYK